MSAKVDADVVAWTRTQHDAAQAERQRREHRDAERRADALDAAFTSHERSTACHALIVAAERFEADAQYIRDQRDAGSGFARLAEQFDRQAKDSRDLAERMEP